MYKLDQVDDRIIWLFREPRSGSDWLTRSLSNALKRQVYFINKNTVPYPKNVTSSKRTEQIYFENRKQELNDHTLLLNTHCFNALESLDNYANPIVIRSSRRNRTEQFISQYLAWQTSNFNVFSQDAIAALPKFEPFTIPEDDLYHFIKIKKSTNNLWKDYASKYENEIVYYEDLLLGWESKIFNLKLRMTNDSDDYFPKKLPYNKKEFIINYDQIDGIIKEELNNL